MEKAVESNNSPYIKEPQDYGFGEYIPESGAWKGKSTKEKTKDVSRAIFNFFILACAISAVVFVVTFPLSILLAPLAFIITMVAGTVLVAKSQKKLEKMGNVKELKFIDNENIPKVNEYSQNTVFVTKSAKETTDMKLALIKKAKYSIEISGSYCGGTIFNEFLDAIENRMKEEKSLKVKILSSAVLLTKENHKKIKDLANKYSTRFCLLVTKAEKIFLPTYRTEENHTKIVIIDGKVCVTGGTGIEDSLSSDGKDTGSLKNKNGIKFLRCHGSRDMDVLLQGHIAKTMKKEFHNLFHKWSSKKSTKKYGSTILDAIDLSIKDNKELDDYFNTFDASRLTQNIKAKFIASSYEHGNKNACKEQYIYMIKNAKNSIQIANMSISNEDICKAIKEAGERGVKVDIITNLDNDKNSAITKSILSVVNKNNVLKFFKGLTNIKCYGYDEDSILFHKKVMVIDEKKVVIGSFNLSYHCSDTEDEDVVVLSSEKCAKKVKDILQEDIDSSELFTIKKNLIGDCFKKMKASLVLHFTKNVFQ